MKTKMKLLAFAVSVGVMGGAQAAYLENDVWTDLYGSAYNNYAGDYNEGAIPSENYQPEVGISGSGQVVQSGSYYGPGAAVEGPSEPEWSFQYDGYARGSDFNPSPASTGLGASSSINIYNRTSENPIFQNRYCDGPYMCGPMDFVMSDNKEEGPYGYSSPTVVSNAYSEWTLALGDEAGFGDGSVTFDFDGLLSTMGDGTYASVSMGIEAYLYDSETDNEYILDSVDFYDYVSGDDMSEIEDTFTLEFSIVEAAAALFDTLAFRADLETVASVDGGNYSCCYSSYDEGSAVADFSNSLILTGGTGSGAGVTPVPVPAAAYLLGSGLIGFVAMRRRKMAEQLDA